MVLRVVALALLVAAVLMPTRTRAAAPSEVSHQPTLPASGLSIDAGPSSSDELDGGACGDEHEQAEELVDCGSELSFFERPALLDVLGGALERMQADKCLTLLDILYEREACHNGGRECGDVLPLALPPLSIKSMSSGASSGQVSPARDSLAADEAARVRIRASDIQPPRPRSIAPPDRPPR